jgi:hypothetical protein
MSHKIKGEYFCVYETSETEGTKLLNVVVTIGSNSK